MQAIKQIRFLPKTISYNKINSPVGELAIITSSAGLHAILWDNPRKNSQYEKMINGLTRSENEITIVRTQQQLTEYFQGQRKQFDLPLIMCGTDFQIQAWNELLKIPYSSTISYGEQAEKIGNKNKARAVGMANGLNPIPIIVPCHRVIGSNGHLVGFAGGTEKKAYLLKLEASQ